MAFRKLDSQLSRRHPGLRFFIEVSSFLIVIALMIVGGRALYYRMVDLPLLREQQRLLAVNAPAVLFPTCKLNFTDDGKLQLPDGRHARLAELDLSRSADQKRIDSEASSVLDLIKTSKLGYTITSTDSDGTPVVHVWALSVNQFRGLDMDDGDEYEHRRAKWLLWRNLSAVLVEEANFNRNGTAGERLEPHTIVR